MDAPGCGAKNQLKSPYIVATGSTTAKEKGWFFAQACPRNRDSLDSALLRARIEPGGRRSPEELSRNFLFERRERISRRKSKNVECREKKNRIPFLCCFHVCNTGDNACRCCRRIFRTKRPRIHREHDFRLVLFFFFLAFRRIRFVLGRDLWRIRWRRF